MLSPSTSALGPPATNSAADQIGLRQAIRAGLHRVADLHAPLRAVAEQGLEQRLLVRRVDDEHFADARQHQGAERVIDHRLVVDRQQLLADALGDRIQPGAGAAGQDDTAALSHERGSFGRSAQGCAGYCEGFASSGHSDAFHAVAAVQHRRTQSWFARYQSTVAAMPRSKVIAGRQPSSVCSLEASIA
jgi:hypothetical protein